MTVLVHSRDARPCLIITSGVLVALVPFFVPLCRPLLVLLFLTSMVLRAIAPVHQHCHAHRKLFWARAWNDVYDFVLLLAAGNTTAIWELQHVHGHHPSHLDPPNDPANSSRFTKEGPLQRLLFTVAGDCLSFSDSLRVAGRSASAAKLRGRLWRQQAIAVLTLLALLAWNPLMALLVFVAPNILLRWTVFYFSYAQHHGTPGGDVFGGSVTRFGWTNYVFLNVGHHTAHHEKPTLHWTLLPARTERIRHRIPAECLRGVG